MGWFARTSPPDHDRLILLELRLTLLAEQLRKEVDAALRQVEIQDERLVAGNRRFNDLDLYQQQTTDAITELRNAASGARLSADNAGRAVESIAKAMDKQVDGVQDTLSGQIAGVRAALTDRIDGEMKGIRAELSRLDETITTWTVQGRLLRVLSGPLTGIIFTILTTFLLKWLFP